MPEVDYQVSANDDDAREAADGTVGLSNEQVVDETSEYYGHRWTVTLPRGVTIITAWIDLWIIDDTSDEPDHTIYFEDSANPTAFSASANNISSRTPTTITATLSSADLGVDAAGNWISDVEDMPFPELRAIIQELVDSYDYSAGAPMVAIIRGSAILTRDLRRMDYSTDPTKAAKLHIEYAFTPIATIDIPPGLPITSTHQTVDLPASKQAISLDGLPLGESVFAEGTPSPIQWNDYSLIRWNDDTIIEWDDADLTPQTIDLKR